MFLFGLTYVYVGLDYLLGLGSRGLGWFCGMVGACGLLLAAAWSGEDPLLAVLWLGWTFLWLLFFLRWRWASSRVDAVHRLGAGPHQPGLRHSAGVPGADRAVAAQPVVAAAALAGRVAAGTVALAGGLAWRGRHQTAARHRRRHPPAVESPLAGELKV